MSQTHTKTELQRSSEQFLRALMALQVKELEKQALDDDPRRIGLGIDIEELTLGLLGRSQYQPRLAADLQGAVLAEPRHTPKMLSDWRVAERRLRKSEPIGASARARGHGAAGGIPAQDHSSDGPGARERYRTGVPRPDGDLAEPKDMIRARQARGLTETS
jgi:hypothetical protein